jgi:hypothetical protein
MLRDELQHEQLCRMVLQHLTPDWPLHDRHPTTSPATCTRRTSRPSSAGLVAGVPWTSMGSASWKAGLLLVELVTGELYDGWATTCAIPDHRQPEPPVELQARHAGFGVPTAARRQEVLRAALLKVNDLQVRYGIPFPAMPELAIAGTERNTTWRGE